MFNDLLTKCVKPKKVIWEAPNKISLDLDNDEGMKTYDLLKGAEEFLHEQIGVKPSTSKELYKKEHDLWKEFRDARLNECENQPNENDRFSLTKPTVYYLINEGGEVVDIVDLKREEYVEEFLDKHQKFNVDLSSREVAEKFYTDCKNGLVKIICYKSGSDVTSKEFTPVVILEFNANKSNYMVYRGAFMYKKFTFIPAISSDIWDDNLSELINHFDMATYLDYAEERLDELVDAYKAFVKTPVEISVRELTSIFKRVGYKLDIDAKDTLHPIENMTDEVNNGRIQEFFNTFTSTTGETALEILKLSEFRKTFRYNKLTLLDTLEIMSKEYLTYDGSKVEAKIIGDIVYKLCDSRNVDKFQVESLKRETD